MPRAPFHVLVLAYRRGAAGIPASAPSLRLDATAMIPACWFPAWPSWADDVLVVPEHAFAVDVGDHAIIRSAEHDDVRWVHHDEAVALLRFDSNRVALWESRWFS